MGGQVSVMELHDCSLCFVAVVSPHRAPTNPAALGHISNIITYPFVSAMVTRRDTSNLLAHNECRILARGAVLQERSLYR
jgi:hypothetical protein